MRIAYVCADPGVPVFGAKGASVHVQGVLGALLRAGAEVELFAAQVGGHVPLDLRSVVLHDLGRPATSSARAREVALTRANHGFRRRLLAAGPFDLVYERQALFAWAGMELAYDTAAVAVLEVNAPLVEEQATHRTLVDRAGARRGVRRSLAAARSVLAASRQLGDMLDACPEARGKVHVVPNGVDPARFEAPRPRNRIRPFTVAFVGTLKPWHGLDTLVEAFVLLRRTVPDARLLVVGDGPGRADLERQVQAAGIDEAVRFTGAVPPAAVGALLARADASVAPYPATTGRYFSPLKVLESMAAGVPVVSTSVGQLPELIRNGETGLLCEPGDPAAVARALAALAANPVLRRQIRTRARSWVLAHHSWDGVAQRILELAASPERCA
jgi:glycosyltransferase involved in cell wall biosynthesis